MHKRFLGYINQKLDFDRKETVLKVLDDESSPDFDFFMLIILSCTIATLGLITDSLAVIIGAMLVAPLMSPIMGLSLASVVGEQRLFKRAISALVEGMLLAILLSCILAFILYHLPFGILEEIPNEVLVRTRPSPFDLVIALAGGAAAAYALAMPKLSAALPGVAISTALMPPLCTIGIGIGIQNANVIFGATLIFLTNLLAISFSGIVIFLWLGFRPLNLHKKWRGLPNNLMISAIFVALVTIPLSVLAFRSLQEANFAKTIETAIDSSLESFTNAQLVDFTYSNKEDVLNLEISIYSHYQPSYQQLLDLQSNIASAINQTVALKLVVIPTTNLDPLIPPTPTNTLVFTLTPSLTPTFTFTPTQTFTPTITLTPSLSPTITPTVTLTPTPTATMMVAKIAGTGGNYVYLRENAGGNISHSLPEGAYLRLTGNEETINNILWLEVIDLVNRQGWLPAQYVLIQP